MRVGLFATCLIDLMRPQIGFAVLKLLEQAGCTVEVPERQTCCGQPAYNSGDTVTARRLALDLLHLFEGYDYVVVPSGSCAATIKGDYPDLFRDDPDLRPRFDALAARTWELTDFLANVCKVERLDARYDGEVTYHDSCGGYRYLGIHAQPRRLLGMVEGLRLKEMDQAQQCCGFGGTFALKYGAISGAIVDDKCHHIRASGASAVVLGDLGCMLNIEGRLRRRGDEATRVLHIAQVLAGTTGDDDAGEAR